MTAKLTTTAGRLRIFLLVALSPALTLHAPPASGPTAAQAASPWQFGEYTQFTPPGDSRAPAASTRGATAGALKLSRTAVQRPQVAPGEAADLIAEYQVSVPEGTLNVREIRIVRFEGQRVARLEKIVSVPSGPAGTKVALKVPSDAARGLYSVTTTIEPVAPETRSGGGADTGDRALSMFRVETRAAPPPPTPPGDAPAGFKLWTEKTRHKVGDTMKVLFQADRNGYVTLVNVGTSGRITILYPNAYAPNHAVKAGQAYSVPAPGDPYDLTLSGPEGVELVYAVFTTMPTRFVDANFTKDAFTTVNDKAEEFTRDINVALKRIPLKEQANAAIEIEVTR